MSQAIARVKNLLVIDSQVSNWQSLAAGAGTDTAVLILDSGSDGLTQISHYLTTLAASTPDFVPLQSLQIISHGSAGSLLLGSSTLTTGSLKQYTSQLTSIGSSLTATGDILLYGCNVAVGQNGLDFINQFAALTNADVAASNDITGSAALGGDWQLEAGTGTIESALVLNKTTLNNYTDVLAPTNKAPTLSLFSENISIAKVTNSGILGSWRGINMGQSNSEAVITFLSDGTYSMAEDGNTNLDPSGQDGMERGTYSWNPVSGAFSYHTLVDTSGEWGLSHSAITNLTVSGNALTLTAGIDSFTLARIVNPGSPIVGSWHGTNMGQANSESVITFLSDNTYFIAEDGNSNLDPSGHDGMEHGTYSWNPAKGTFSYHTLVDTNGEWGLSHSAIFNLGVVNNIISSGISGIKDTENTVTFVDLQKQSNATDTDGTIAAFVIKAVSTGTLKIGTSATTAATWNASSNNTIDATHQAYWTPAAHANGLLNAFTVVAKDNGGLVSATAIQAKIAVVADTTPPTVTITDNLSGTAHRTTASIAYTLAFSEPVTGLAANDFTLANGTISSVTGSGNSWTVNVTPALGVSTGSIGLTLKAGAVSDGAGNLNASVTNSSQGIDTVAPVAPKLITNAAFNALIDPQLTLKTSLGTVVLELNPEQAPVTVANMLAYANGSFYDNTLFHRVIAGFMVQGGGYSTDYNPKTPTYSPIMLESNNGLSNLRGTIAMARTNVADSATAQFFVNQVDNKFLDYTNAANLGYAVFGKVLSGLTVIDSITKVATYANGLPKTDIIITSLKQTLAGSSITNAATLTVSDLEAGAKWAYSLNNGSTWKIGTGNSFVVPLGNYAASAIQVRQTDAAGNVSASAGKLTSALVVETTAPTVTSFNPADGNTGAALASNIVLTFSETIQKGTGLVQLRSGSATGTVIENFNAATNNHLVLSGNTLTIDPTNNLANNTQYFVTFASGTIKDLAGNSYAGTTTYDFRTINVVTGTSGNDTLNGLAGTDKLIGGLGNDIYVVNNTGDVVTETSTLATEIDTVNSSITYTLPVNVENLTLTGTAALNGTGNALNNTLTGNAAANTLNGGAGNDILTAGNGTDKLTGGTGSDTLDFNALTELGLGAARDVITDFVRGQDKIDLLTIDPNSALAGNQAFRFISAATTFSVAGQIHYSAGIISLNTDTDAAPEYEIQLTGVIPSVLAATDFVL